MGTRQRRDRGGRRQQTKDKRTGRVQKQEHERIGRREVPGSWLGPFSRAYSELGTAYEQGEAAADR